MEIAVEQVILLFTTYPWLKTALACLFLVRIVNKILFAVLGKYVQLTDTTKDNEWYKKITGSKTYQFISFILDLGLSFKLPK